MREKVSVGREANERQYLILEGKASSFNVFTKVDQNFSVQFYNSKFILLNCLMHVGSVCVHVNRNRRTITSFFSASNQHNSNDS